MIPDNWNFRPLGEVATLNPRRPSAIAELPPETQVSFVPMAAVSEVHGKIVSAQNRPLHEVSRGFTYFAEGDVIFAKITPCMENGKSAIAKDLASAVGFGSTEFHVIRPSAPLLAQWVHLFIRQQSFRNEAANHFRGSAGQQRVPSEFLSQFVIPVPPIDEQRRIIARVDECLRRIQEIEDIQRELCEYPNRIHGAHVLELLGLERLRNWGQAYSYRGDFDWVCLEEICSFISRGRHSKQGDSETYLIKTRHVWPDNLRDYSDCRLSEAEASKVKTSLLVQQNDVLLACSARGSLGRSCFVSTVPPQRVTVDTHVAILRSNSDRIFPRILFEFLNSPLGRYLLVSAEAGGRWHEEKIGFRYAELNLEDLKKIKVPTPSIPRQEEILEQLAKADLVIEPLEANMTSLVNQAEKSKEAILRQAFSGEL